MKRWIIITVCLVLVAAAGVTVWLVLGKGNGVVDVYSPEIVKSYINRNTMITIEKCEEDGFITATCDTVTSSGYAKSKLEGKIISKHINGDIEIEWTKQTSLVAIATEQYVLPTKIYITNKGEAMKIGDASLKAETTKFAPFIENVEDLKKLDGSNDTFVLINDIDLDGENWVSIKEFSGTLVGNGHSIKNLTIEADEDNIGFISVLKGSLVNLNFENASVKVDGVHENVGIVCGLSQNAIINDVQVSGTVDAENSTCVGGIVGKFEVKETFDLTKLKNEADVCGEENVGGICGFMNCYIKSYKSQNATLSNFANHGTVLANGKNAGGIIGYYCSEAYDTGIYPLYVTDFENSGDVSGESYVGGLFGDAYADTTKSYIRNSKSSAAVTAEYMVGGLAGKLENISLISCNNENTTITATKYWFNDGVKYAYVGGYAGYGFTASDCTNTVDIDYTGGGNYVGGILGYSNAKVGYEISSLTNKGAISGADYVGGILGYSKSKESFSMDALKNEGAISGGSYIGGVIGYMDCYIDLYNTATATLSDFVNSGDVTATGDHVGGTIGRFKSEAYDYKTYPLFVTDFENTGDVKGVSHIGGLIGSAYSDGKDSYIKNSNTSANVSGSYIVGGLAGQLEYIYVENCTNTDSAVTADSYFVEDKLRYAYVGGFIGRMQGNIINSCVNNADVSYSSNGRYVGGIAGYLYLSETFAIADLQNEGNVTGDDFTGGIFGHLECLTKSSSSLTLSGFINNGSVIGQYYTAGIVGYISSEANNRNECPLYAIELINNGEISGTNYVGGIFGHGKTDSMSSKLENSRGDGKVTGYNYYDGLMGAFDTISIKYTS